MSEPPSTGRVDPDRAAVVTLPDAEWLEAVGDLPPGLRGRVWDVELPADEVLEAGAADDVVAVVLPHLRPAGALDCLARLPRLRLVQTLTAGYEGVQQAVPSGVELANAAGVHDASTAELAVALLLASQRGLDDAVREADRQLWRPRQRASLADRRVLLVGTGGIGGAVAARLAPFEVQLTRVGRTAREVDGVRVHGVEELSELLPQHDVVVLTVPLTDATRGLVDAAFLAAMPDDALLVNVARGPVVDTDALVAELRTGRLRAALDVVDPEPLPAGHPLWEQPGLLLTPHVGGSTTAMRPRALALLADQLDRLASGRPLRNVIPGPE